jgi:hypothetical protein
LIEEGDATEAVRQIALRDAKEKQLNKAKAQVEEARAELVKEQEKQVQEYVSREVDLVKQAIPKWQDDKVRVSEQTNLINKAMEKYGFGENELQIFDHRHWRVLQDAILGSDLKSKSVVAEKKVKKAPKVIKSQGAKSKSQVKSESIQSRFKQLKGATGNNATRQGAALLKELNLI